MECMQWNYFRKSKDACRGKQKRETFCFYVLVNDTGFVSNLESLVVRAKKGEAEEIRTERIERK